MSLLTADTFKNTTLSSDVVEKAKRKLSDDGWVLLRGFDTNLQGFSNLAGSICTTLSFDPAREYSAKNVQKVDAGKEAIGLHIENGNTPFPPDMVAFFCEKSVKHGSQTTLCDGAALWEALPEVLKEPFKNNIIVSRELSPIRWKTYVANELLDGAAPERVTLDDLQQLLEAVPGQDGQLDDKDNLLYSLTVKPVLESKLSTKPAFANALLGPSYNYDPPVYRFENGQVIDESFKKELALLSEQLTEEVKWQDGDVVLIDNKRVMHGRREIIGPIEDRRLFIAMGSL